MIKLIIHQILSVPAAFLRSCPRIAAHPTCNPEKPRKSLIRRYFECVYLRFRDGGVPLLYNALGLDCMGVTLGEFVGNHTWFKCFGKWARKNSADYTVLLNDKYLFWMYFKDSTIPVVPIYYRTTGGILQATCSRGGGGYNGPLFMKPVNDMCGRGACKVEVCRAGVLCNGAKLDLRKHLRSGQELVFQPIITNHSKIKSLNQSTLNTLRIATCINRQGGVELWDSGMMRIGRKNAQVDNFAQGGVGVGILPSGKLRKWGFCHDKQLCYFMVDRHPDSLIPFENFEVPFYEEATKLVVDAHRRMPWFRSIAWDVAVTADGPMLLEGNHNWDMEMLQVVHGKGCRKRLMEIYGDILQEG